MKRLEGPTNDERGVPAEVLAQMVRLFESRGWLDRPIMVKRRNRRYRLFCSQDRFLAYKLNESWGISPGVPGWPVCLVTRDRVFHDAVTCAFTAEEPETDEWLRLLSHNDIEVTQTI